MTTATLTAEDIRVREAVRRQLDWDPDIDVSGVGVAAKGGVVTLSGFIDTYIGKLTAERVAKRVRGVRAVANELGVRPKVGRTDVDIATDTARALELRSTVPAAVQAVVHNGTVTLTGKVDWLAQKLTAEKAVRHIQGVRAVLNHIEVAPKAIERDVRDRIVQALHRTADLEARHISVATTDRVVVLTGTVGSWQQRDSAEAAAANAPGITHVDNRIVVEPPALPEEPEIC